MSDDCAHRVITAAFESPEAMITLVYANPDLLEARTGLDETPLHYLAVENQLSAVVLLIEAGATIDTLNSCRETPLSNAALLGYEEMVEFLLSCGASLQIPGQDESVLHNAVRSANTRVVQLILDAGAPINEQNDIRETALHLAAEEDTRLPALELLLKSGADSTVQAIFNETPLDVALRREARACAAVLVANGAPRCTSVV